MFLTGHTGFKGTWLTLWLQHLGATVSGYALAPSTTPSFHDLVGDTQADASVIADIADRARLEQSIAASKPEVVFHLAAQPLVRQSYEDPVETYATNVMGTAHLLEAVRASAGVTAVVVVTSDKAYENREWPWGYRESDPMGGYDPYSSSKGCTELLAASWRASFFNPSDYAKHGVALATARAGNVIGGGDWSRDRLVPDLLAAFAEGKPALIRNPDAMRPWQHVLEPLHGYLTLAEKLATEGPQWGQSWNFGPEDSDTRPVSWIADQLARLWGGQAAWVADGQQHPHEANWLKLDCSKARQQLGWTPRWNLQQALEAIASWQRAWQAGNSMRDFSLRQIAEYESTSRHA